MHCSWTWSSRTWSSRNRSNNARCIYLGRRGERQKTDRGRAPDSGLAGVGENAAIVGELAIGDAQPVRVRYVRERHDLEPRLIRRVKTTDDPRWETKSSVGLNKL